ncbi:MAG: lysine--tRNA ligase [Acidobacteriota bacterium]
MSELDVQIANRRAKRDELAASGQTPYPHRFDFDLEPSEIHARYGEQSAEELEAAALRLRVPGRVTALRRQGKLIFADVHDGKTKLQLFLRKNAMPEEVWERFLLLDIGDHVGVAGPLMRTRKGELSLAADELLVLAKSLRPMPEKWSGVKDIELRYRQRYLDLMSNPPSRHVFETRAALVRGIRHFLEERGFLEVETPMMQAIAGGAAARPFVTHHNALDVDLYLRIAPELYLKRLLVGGIPRVYEINRNFRNEGISTQHNPEFTMLEFYWAYADYQDLMDLVEELVGGLARDILDTTTLPWDGRTLDFSRPWARYTMRDAVLELGGVDAAELETVDSMVAALEARGAEVPKARDAGHLLAALFDATVEHQLQNPTFITDFPVEISPLAKQKPDDPSLTERFELFVAGMELANAFSELNDPDVQAERFRQQLAAREAGDDEAHAYDEDYVTALEHGMPPAGGCGIGIDRLTMLFTDRQSIRDVILFPLLRPLAADADADADADAGAGTEDDAKVAVEEGQDA